MTPEQERLVVKHMGLAQRVASKHILSSEERDDIVSDAYMGLVAAARTYRPGSSPFATHAYLRIRGSIADGRRARGALSRQDFAIGSGLEGARKQFMLREQRNPTTADLLSESGWTRADYAIHEERRSRAYPKSLSDPTTSDDTGNSGTIGEMVRDPALTADEAIDRSEPHLHDALARLTGRERFVLGLRFWQGCTQPQIADMMGCTPSRVCQIQTQAMDQLRNHLCRAAA